MKMTKPPKHRQQIYAYGMSDEEYNAARTTLMKCGISVAYCIEGREWRIHKIGGRPGSGCAFSVTLRTTAAFVVDYLRDPQSLIEEMGRREAAAQAHWDDMERGAA
jgi:hypothetical protein